MTAPIGSVSRRQERRGRDWKRGEPGGPGNGHSCGLLKELSCPPLTPLEQEEEDGIESSRNSVSGSGWIPCGALATRHYPEHPEHFHPPVSSCGRLLEQSAGAEHMRSKRSWDLFKNLKSSSHHPSQNGGLIEQGEGEGKGGLSEVWDVSVMLRHTTTRVEWKRSLWKHGVAKFQLSRCSARGAEGRGSMDWKPCHVGRWNFINLLWLRVPLELLGRSKPTEQEGTARGKQNKML